jgi:anti-sigma factor ChrR (cupin superfamily)
MTSTHKNAARSTATLDAAAQAMQPRGLVAVDVDDVPALVVGPGCTRRDLPSGDRVRAWIVDIAAGAQWPWVDRHDVHGEEVYIVSGELIEGDRRYGAGHFLTFGPHSSHHPRTDTGVRLFGINVRN